MNPLRNRPSNGTAQLLEFAQSGRLVSMRGKTRLRGMIALVIAAAISIGCGAAVTIGGLDTGTHSADTLLGAFLVLSGLCLLVPSVHLLSNAVPGGSVKVRPGAVLPPDLVQEGNWIYRQGAWMRVEHVGRDGGGHVQALLSSGDVVDVRTPVTVAGDALRPVHDPVESLRG